MKGHVISPKRKAAAALILTLLLAPGIYFATRPHDAVLATWDPPPSLWRRIQDQWNKWRLP